MFIRPALDLRSEIEGARLLIRDPDTMKHLSVDGEEKPETEYWHRRVLEGAVDVRSADDKWADAARPEPVVYGIAAEMPKPTAAEQERSPRTSTAGSVPATTAAEPAQAEEPRP